MLVVPVAIYWKVRENNLEQVYLTKNFNKAFFTGKWVIYFVLGFCLFCLGMTIWGLAEGSE